MRSQALQPRNRTDAGAALLPPGPSRAGYTLLEVILTLAIAALVMAGLYVALFTQLHFAQSGRDIIQRSASARNLLKLIAADIENHLAPASPWLSHNYPTGGATGSGAASSTPATTSNSTNASNSQTGNSATANSASANSASANSGTPGTMTNTSGDGVFNVGVRGDNGYLRLSLSRFRPGKLEDGVSDLARIEYWIVEGKGLARREVTRVTADDEDVDPTTLPDADKHVIGPEVVGIQIRYWDGTQWTDSWDGLQPGTDANMTPLGPPAAIEITLRVRVPNRGGDDQVRQYQHVVAIRTANMPQQTTQ